MPEALEGDMPAPANPATSRATIAPVLVSVEPRLAAETLLRDDEEIIQAHSWLDAAGDVS
ncbi:hypothetical protein [Paenarthrobacter nitroguajacolicus]|uniref:hypothetical protein n=1 Tax=Paenarthrobacter nitroguajacolicus TaxID=211146 RepID=UPI004054001E